MKTILLLLVVLGCSFFVNSKILPNGVYYLESVEYGLYWEGCGFAPCDHVFTFDPYLDEYQRFIFTRLDNGYYTIIFPYNGEAVAASPDAPYNVFLVTSVDPNAHEQQFKLVHRGGDNYIIKPRLHPSQAIQSGANQVDSLFLNDKDCISSLQQFKFIFDSSLDNTSRRLTRRQGSQF